MSSKGCWSINMAASKGRVILKAVKEIAVQFCPFESNTRSTREFLVLVGSEKARGTNLNCEVKTQVKHDSSEPVINIAFSDGERLVMKGAQLTSREMLSAFQSRCIAKDPQAKMAAKK
ncbi:39S ribosomal protein L53, mitochondrial isoform X2 [Clupea harengus]|uniref:Large ribosomal subunit protein mL53 n=1 Tax=Clupea harengus TaxID=7950 RepID=A0A6P8H484_CLUHA|nr:39S ribosomal protein L53, mitochondrial isoform X1 [Clupea harengus]XP_031442060.1 39S ribosomal protein L53, mitochondrial isoform X2 [Clupea harengus]